MPRCPLCQITWSTNLLSPPSSSSPSSSLFSVFPFLLINSQLPFPPNPHFSHPHHLHGFNFFRSHPSALLRLAGPPSLASPFPKIPQLHYNYHSHLFSSYRFFTYSVFLQSPTISRFRQVARKYPIATSQRSCWGRFR